MAIRRPRFRYQIGDPTTSLDGYICNLESGAMTLDAHTLGRVSVWGGQLIPYCGRTAYSIKQSGTNLYNIKSAWQHWGQVFTVRNGNKWAGLISDLKAGRWVVLQGDYDQFSLATKCQDSFYGNHSIVVGPERDSSGRWLTADPLCKTFKYLGEGELRRYAEDFGRQVYAKAHMYWSGQILYGVTRIVATMTAPATLKYKVSIPASLFFIYNVSGGVITSRVSRNTGGFSATAVGDYKLYWPAQGKYVILVKINSGAYSGHYINRDLAVRV